MQVARGAGGEAHAHRRLDLDHTVELRC
jgi:hypothetical protein